MLKKAKGFRFARSKKERNATEALLHAGYYAFAHRRRKKSDFRQLFQNQIGAFAKENNTSYSKLISLLKKNNVALDRKILATLANTQPETLKRVLGKIGK